jgi:hypothetical protein
MYQKELQVYLANRYADNNHNVNLLTGGSPELFAYMQLMWTSQFHIKRCEELERVISGLEDVIEGKDGEIADMHDIVDKGVEK